MFCAVCDFSNSNLKDKQYNEKTAPKSYKIEIKIRAYLGLTYGLLTTQQPRPGLYAVRRSSKMTTLQGGLVSFPGLYLSLRHLLQKNSVSIFRSEENQWVVSLSR